MMPELSSDPSLIPARRRTTLWERQARRQGRSRCPRASSRPDDLDRCHRCYRYIDTSICSVQLFDDSCDLRFRWRRGSQCTTMTSVRSAPDSFASFSRHHEIHVLQLCNLIEVRFIGVGKMEKRMYTTQSWRSIHCSSLSIVKLSRPYILHAKARLEAKAVSAWLRL